MKIIRVGGIRARFDADENVELSVQDLARSKDPALHALARVDAGSPSRDRWLSRPEMDQAFGLTVPSHERYTELVRAAQKVAFEPGSIANHRAGSPRPQAARPPPPVSAPAKGYAALSRKEFVPLAEYLAVRLASADSFEASFGEPGVRVFHFRADDLVARYSMHEIMAACAILTAREASEFGLARDRQGHYHFIQGKPDKVEYAEEITGLDLVFHTHPMTHGSTRRGPSPGDLELARALDPDHRGAVVSEDGWHSAYRAAGPRNEEAPPVRLWKPLT